MLVLINQIYEIINQIYINMFYAFLKKRYVGKLTLKLMNTATPIVSWLWSVVNEILFWYRIPYDITYDKWCFSRHLISCKFLINLASIQLITKSKGFLLVWSLILSFVLPNGIVSKVSKTKTPWSASQEWKGN